MKFPSKWRTRGYVKRGGRGGSFPLSVYLFLFEEIRFQMASVPGHTQPKYKLAVHNESCFFSQQIDLAGIKFREKTKLLLFMTAHKFQEVNSTRPVSLQPGTDPLQTAILCD
jgi:hypothetical protein